MGGLLFYWALVIKPAAEQRKKVAPDVSPGFIEQEGQAPEGRQTPFWPLLRSFCLSREPNPQLTLWATF